VPTAPAKPALTAVALPELSNASAAVQAQIRERYASLKAAIDKPDTTPTALAGAYGEMGKLFIAAEYFDAAQACFDNARTLAPSDLRWPYYLGHVFRFKNEPARAVTAFEQALAIQGDHVPSLIWLADMHLTLNETEAAEPLLVKARALHPDEGAVLYGLGRVALAKKDYSTAVMDLERALSVAPHATRIHYPLAMAYRGLGNRTQAEAHLRKRGDVDLPPADPLIGELGNLLQNAVAYETRGAEAMNDRRWTDAVTNLRKASELAPSNAFTRLNLGTSLYMTGDAAGALEQFQAAIRLSPGLAKAHYGIGVLMEVGHRDAEAISEFSAAVKADPMYAEARQSLADALRRNGRVQEALPHYAEVLKANPAASQAAFGYAMGLVRLRRFAEARDRFTAAVKTFPDQPGFAHALARLLAAAPDDHVRDGMRAMALMRDLLKSQQQTIGMAETMAMTLAELGRFGEAMEWQKNAIAAATDGKRPDLAARLAVNLRLYESKQPCRIPWADDDPVHHPVVTQ